MLLIDTSFNWGRRRELIWSPLERTKVILTLDITQAFVGDGMVSMKNDVQGLYYCATIN